MCFFNRNIRNHHDRRVNQRSRSLFNTMPLGYCKRKNKIERRSPVERRSGWVRCSFWQSENTDFVYNVK
jgi:hypothetical protein